ncbi:DNA repair protein RecN [Arthrobacter sp. I2-34]|uniref:DNA repair protein RecN n=1 Tax=Arthrobacter hankyongi TaxID=2904801 RepID=A0ABS9LAU9_9MICC|nr:DNA repair protein RecN [Arthrobacter hankyongi]MCG2623801.1 DNA repair protein RecN [Arthrobacter hankyongi]
MIEEIRIRNLGVITEATLPLGPGLSVVTGETGAGKTMVVTALGLLLGARADAGAVRTGAPSAVAEAIVRLTPDSPALARAAEAGAEIEEFDGAAELMLARTVNADGRSRAHVGGRSAPVGVLAELGEQLVAVHGQSDQLRLKSQAAQREALDKFAGPALAKALAAYQGSYHRWRDASAELEALRTAARERLREAESLQLALEEIDGVDPQPGEDEALKAEALKLANVEQLRAAATLAHQALVAEEDYGESSDAVTLVEAARRSLEQASDEDPELGKAAERLAEVGYVLADVAHELASYAAALDTEGPGRLEEVENRRADLAKLVRKYAPSIDEVLEWSSGARQRLDELTDDSSRIERLEAEIGELAERLKEQSAAVTSLRQKAAGELAARVGEELAALAMANAQLTIGIEPAELSAHGADSISFLLKPHPGAAPRPLGKGASGGELSRVMLAIEVVLAAVDPVPTFVFDEVDSGVGGKAAVEIGRRLAMLAKYVQVIVVTHLPQVAAFAGQHIRVFKTSAPAGKKGSEGVTASDVTLLTDEERITELARMLAGQEESESARAHALELIEGARQSL